jgi:hypothetical protein
MVFQQRNALVNRADVTHRRRYVPSADWQDPFGPGSSIKGKDNHPVVNVAYEDAKAYAEWLSHSLLPRLNGSLPHGTALRARNMPGATLTILPVAGRPTPGKAIFQCTMKRSTASHELRRWTQPMCPGDMHRAKGIVPRKEGK